MTVPADLSVGDTYRIVFVTEVVVNPGASLLSVYDSIVTSDALSQPELAALATTWQVLGSTRFLALVHARVHTNTDPTNGSDPDVPIYNLQGELVASGNADLWDGSLQNAIRYGADAVQNASDVFTGTNPRWTRPCLLHARQRQLNGNWQLHVDGEPVDTYNEYFDAADAGLLWNFRITYGRSRTRDCISDEPRLGGPWS